MKLREGLPILKLKWFKGIIQVYCPQSSQFQSPKTDLTNRHCLEWSLVQSPKTDLTSRHWSKQNKKRKSQQRNLYVGENVTPVSMVTTREMLLRWTWRGEGGTREEGREQRGIKDTAGGSRDQSWPRPLTWEVLGLFTFFPRLGMEKDLQVLQQLMIMTAFNRPGVLKTGNEKIDFTLK